MVTTQFYQPLHLLLAVKAHVKSLLLDQVAQEALALTTLLALLVLLIKVTQVELVCLEELILVAAVVALVKSAVMHRQLQTLVTVETASRLQLLVLL
jgi:hypothetical protein